jgi:hypothetical protein
MKTKIYDVSAKYIFRMTGTSKDDVTCALDILFDSLVECHSSAGAGGRFTGKFPIKVSVVAKPVKEAAK